MTFFTGPGAVLSEQSYKGHILAAEEIKAQGGFLGNAKLTRSKRMRPPAPMRMSKKCAA